MLRLLATVVAFALLPSSMAGSWQSLQELRPGQRIEVSRKAGDPITGTLVRLGDDSITVGAKQGEITIPRADITRVRTSRSGHAKWFGLGIGAARSEERRVGKE